MLLETLLENKIPFKYLQQSFIIFIFVAKYR